MAGNDDAWAFDPGADALQAIGQVAARAVAFEALVETTIAAFLSIDLSTADALFGTDPLVRKLDTLERLTRAKLNTQDQEGTLAVIRRGRGADTRYGNIVEEALGLRAGRRGRSSSKLQRHAIADFEAVTEGSRSLTVELRAELVKRRLLPLDDGGGTGARQVFALAAFEAELRRAW